ncbi:MAG: hypothetical protein Ct9H300mP19_04030 [Dehalococcoidia bacterium]|nr:MAG: hypothetical protein Ct9H300mP19_04030 [Dehalococcoidia bacterium]
MYRAIVAIGRGNDVLRSIRMSRSDDIMKRIKTNLRDHLLGIHQDSSRDISWLVFLGFKCYERSQRSISRRDKNPCMH